MGRHLKGRCSRVLAGVLVASLLGGLPGCSSQKASSTSPDLPAKYWLDEAPGVPVQNKPQYDQVIEDLYDPDKKFGFSDLVYLTIQQSPALVNSAVNIEIKRLAQTNAAWKYLPEPNISIKLSQNITNYNQGARDKPSGYGKPQYEIGFWAPFPNPVATYYEGKAQSMMSGVAISTHRKAIAEAIYNIGEAYLCLQAQQYSIAAKKALVPLNTEMVDYWKQVEAVSGNQGSSVLIAQQRENEAKLDVDKVVMQDTVQRTQLKLLAGVDANHKLMIDPTNADSEVIGDFNGKALHWEEEWVNTEDYMLLRTQLKLYDYNIMLQWAQYVPNMTINVNMNAPRGQSQPDDGTEDYFFHFTFSFPLIDWGRRYRDVQTARMQKAQAFHQIAQKRAEFQNKWLQAEQQAELALTDLKLAQSRYKTKQMQYDEARIGFENGLEQLPVVAERQEAMVNAQIKFIEAERDYRLALLKWMYVSGELQKRFIGLPSREQARLVGFDPVKEANDIANSAPDPSDVPIFAPMGAPAAASAAAGAAEDSTGAAAKTRAKEASRPRPIGHVRPVTLPPVPGQTQTPAQQGNTAPDADLKATPTL